MSVMKFLMALILPGLLVILFTRVTFKNYVGLALSVALIAASIYAGYTHPPLLYVVDAISLTIGFWYATKMMNQQKN
ncbi:CsbA family protein [Rummeliibacillus pycnus]|uniref:CsbA family protein n=1 Tax=Rummeliibacillus pycnus TaxID=101070 RepID=UPI000C9C7728|nr:CsbA family protein [Rummeliibacillus pycnus]